MDDNNIFDYEPEFDPDAERRRQEQINFDAKQMVEEIIEEQQPIEVTVEEPIKNNIDDRPWWEKNQSNVEKEIKPKKPKQKVQKEDEELGPKYENPFAFNEGDIDLQPHLRVMLGEIDQLSNETLRMLFNKKYLQVFGTKCWTGLHSKDLKHRIAVCEAVLSYIKLPLLEKYQKNTTIFFLACMEFALIACKDPIVQVYILGLKIMQIALSEPICDGKFISPQVINAAIIQFIPLIIDKISELNHKVRDISLNMLLNIYSHPAVKIGSLVGAVLKICIPDDNYISLFQAPNTQPSRLMQTRLEIMQQIIKNWGYDSKQWNWEDVFKYLCEPCLSHPSSDVRDKCILVIIDLYKEVGEDVKISCDQINNLQPKVSEKLKSGLEQVTEEVELKLKDKLKQQMNEIKEEDEEELQTARQEENKKPVEETGWDPEN